MGTFRVDVTVKNLRDPGRHRTLPVLVDPGATYTTLPREVAESIGCQPIGTRRVLLANGREEEWPVGVVLLTLEGQEGPTFCLIGPNGGPALLGAVTLEEFALGVDSVAKRLVPVRSYLTRLPARRGNT
jgi:predicted aspartyl protease